MDDTTSTARPPLRTDPAPRAVRRARRRALRRVALVLLGALGVLTGLVAVPPSAHAGQVGVTIGIQGAGTVTLVEHSIEDGGPTECTSDNQDDRVVTWCPRVRDSEVFEAWVWLHPTYSSQPPGEWTFDHWDGCDETRTSSGWPECGVHSGAFTSVERRPVAVFRDRLAPVSTITSTTQSDVDAGTFTFAFDAGNGSPQCSLDGGGFAPCESPRTLTLPEGEHLFQVRGVDPSGHVGRPAASSVTTVETTLTATPAALSSSRSARFAYSSPWGADFSCRLDSGPATPCGEATQTSSTSYAGLAEGQHTFRVAGRRGTWYDVVPATFTWTVDTTAPTATLTAREVADRSATFRFTADGDTSCRLTTPSGAGGWTACTSPTTYTGLADGAHVFEVRAQDAAGNVQAEPARHAWTVTAPTDPTGPDATAPDTTLTGGPEQDGWSLSRSTSFTLGSTGVVSIVCTLDGQPRPCSAGTLALSDLGAGTHTLTATAVDAAGRRDSSPATRTWTVPRSAAELPASKGWKRRSAGAAYGGQVLEARRKKATLVVPVTDARRLALVVSVGRKSGAVAVYAGGRKVGRVRLTGTAASAQRLVPLSALPAAYTGVVRIVVTTPTGHPVRIEGLGVATR
jgi:hypothetical protein